MGTGAAARADRIEARTSFDRDSIEFARVANLADAVFAIALTLLVLGLDAPAVGSAELAAALRDAVPNLLAFALGFALVANIWWQHHKFFARLRHLDGGLVARTLALLGLVALVPFPTGLLGAHPTVRAAVVCFISVFVALGLVFISSIRHAQRARAWLRPMPERTYRWIIAGWGAQGAMTLVALAVAVISPLVALLVLACSNAPERLIARWAPTDYSDWS